VPAPAVIPALITSTKFAAVKTLVVGSQLTVLKNDEVEAPRERGHC